MLGLSGLAFAAANLLLARVLPKEEFGRFALLFAIIMIGQSTGPLGANVIVNRYRIDPGRKLLNQVLVTSAVIMAHHWKYAGRGQSAAAIRSSVWLAAPSEEQEVSRRPERHDRTVLHSFERPQIREPLLPDCL